MIQRWVDLWDREEAPHALVAVRVLLGVVVLYDLFAMAWLGLVPVLFGTGDVGLAGERMSALYMALPATESGWLVWGILVGCALAFTCGAATPVAAVMLLLGWAQWTQAMPLADRAVDTLCRNGIAILAFSGCGRAWSVDARLWTGTWRGAERIGAWARYLVIAQIVVMYVTAGIYKTSYLWQPMGGFTALYVLLQDPAIQRFDFAWLANEPWLFGTRVASAVTVYWQWSYILVPVFLFWRETPERGGFLRTWSNRLHLDLIWVGTGALFHLGLFATCELGIFPWAMLALYPALLAGSFARSGSHG